VKDKTHFGFKEVDASEKQSHVKGVFSSVAENYDVMNDAMSMGMHRIWKKILVELSGINDNEKVLDIASGTGDIAKLILNEYPNQKFS
jgi:demethylmenaquinone methyltransferase/2-methoxy-6-polyprenyl-1,4-benzoquinol methylase